MNNIFGGIAMQVTILAMADAAGRGALTGRNRQPGVLLEGTLLILVLNTAAVAIAVGDRLILGVGMWSAAVLAMVILGLFLIKRYEARPRWQPSDELDNEPDDEKTRRANERRARFRAVSTRAVVTQMTLASLAVLAGGFAVAKTGERIAAQTGIGASFVGAILIATATSLPEVSTTLEAVRLGARVMAISNIFGTNLFDAGLLVVATPFIQGPPVLNEVGRFAQVGALLGVACTAIYLPASLSAATRPSSASASTRSSWCSCTPAEWRCCTPSDEMEVSWHTIFRPDTCTQRRVARIAADDRQARAAEGPKPRCCLSRRAPAVVSRSGATPWFCRDDCHRHECQDRGRARAVVAGGQTHRDLQGYAQ